MHSKFLRRTTLFTTLLITMLITSVHKLSTGPFCSQLTGMFSYLLMKDLNLLFNFFDKHDKIFKQLSGEVKINSGGLIDDYKKNISTKEASSRTRPWFHEKNEYK